MAYAGAYNVPGGNVKDCLASEGGRITNYATVDVTDGKSKAVVSFGGKSSP